jgi:hypothetical protein
MEFVIRRETGITILTYHGRNTSPNVLGRYGNLSEKTQAFLFSIAGCEIGILGMVVLFLQTSLWFEAVIQRLGHILLITAIGLTIERVCVIGTSYFIACLLMDTLPIPMLAIPTLGVVPAFS